MAGVGATNVDGRPVAVGGIPVVEIGGFGVSGTSVDGFGVRPAVLGMGTAVGGFAVGTAITGTAVDGFGVRLAVVGAAVGGFAVGTAVMGTAVDGFGAFGFPVVHVLLTSPGH